MYLYQQEASYLIPGIIEISIRFKNAKLYMIHKFQLLMKVPFSRHQQKYDFDLKVCLEEGFR